MSKLQIIIIVSSVVFLIFAIDAFQRKKFNVLHFLIFFGGSSAILLFTLNPEILNNLGGSFGLSRGADLLVYISIIFLGYFYFELLNKFTKTNYNLTRMVSTIGSENTSVNWIFETKKDKYIFLVRAYNEQTTIKKVLQNILKAGYKNILVVNDGSKDNTKSIVKNLQKAYPSICLISHIINRGGGSANKTGIEFLQNLDLDYEYVVTFDADDQMDINDMKNFENAVFNKDYIVALGSRFVEGGGAKNMPTMRKIVLFGSKIITKIFNGIVVSDPHNGYRVISKKALKKIQIFSDDFTYASEILDSIKQNNIPYVEVPVNIRYTSYSLRKGQSSLNAFKILTQLIYTKLFYK